MLFVGYSSVTRGYPFGVYSGSIRRNVQVHQLRNVPCWRHTSHTILLTTYESIFRGLPALPFISRSFAFAANGSFLTRYICALLTPVISVDFFHWYAFIVFNIRAHFRLNLTAINHFPNSGLCRTQPLRFMIVIFMFQVLGWSLNWNNLCNCTSSIRLYRFSLKVLRKWPMLVFTVFRQSPTKLVETLTSKSTFFRKVNNLTLPCYISR